MGDRTLRPEVVPYRVWGSHLEPDALDLPLNALAAQSDLVEPLARFEPRLVKMAPSGEPPED